MTTSAKTITEAQKQKAAAFLSANPVARMVGMHLVDISPGEAVLAFEMRDQKSAGEMKPSGEGITDNYRYVVMPMRI